MSNLLKVSSVLLLLPVLAIASPGPSFPELLEVYLRDEFHVESTLRIDRSGIMRIQDQNADSKDVIFDVITVLEALEYFLLDYELSVDSLPIEGLFYTSDAAQFRWTKDELKAYITSDDRRRFSIVLDSVREVRRK